MTKKLYQADVVVYATAYIMADGPNHARDLFAQNLEGRGLHVCDELIDDTPFDNVPNDYCKLSPCMTIHTPHEPFEKA